MIFTFYNEIKLTNNAQDLGLQCQTPIKICIEKFYLKSKMMSKKTFESNSKYEPGSFTETTQNKKIGPKFFGFNIFFGSKTFFGSFKKKINLLIPNKKKEVQIFLKLLWYSCESLHRGRLYIFLERYGLSFFSLCDHLSK